MKSVLTKETVTGVLRKIQMKQVLPYAGLVLLFTVFSLTTSGRFISFSNLIVVWKQTVVVLIGALGTTFVMAHGNMDFSVGGKMALSAFAGWAASQWNVWLLLPVCIATSVLISYVIGKVHVTLGIPAFTIGMCVMFIGKGFVQSFSSTKTMTVPKVYAVLDTTWFYIVLPVVMIVIAYVLFEFRRLGKFNKAIGVNIETAKFSGVPVGKYKVLAFLVSGVAVGISAFVAMVRTGGVSGQTGMTFEIDVLMALVLGGTSLSGGDGVKIRNGIVGALSYYILNNGLIIWGVSTDVIFIIKGVLFLMIVMFSYDRSTGKELL